MTKKKPKALVLFSGGLDSRLAVKILEKQTKPILIYFKLPFLKPIKLDFIKKYQHKILNCTKQPFFSQYINILKHPKHGQGSSLNPCIDCHLFMLKKAKKYAAKNKIPILATGEVLGERPMSQHKKALLDIQKELGIDILRPLSAKLLPPTKAEQENLIDRSKLLSIQGRNRKPQLALAKKYKITFPSPAGGCLLCEKEYCKKLKPILKKPNLTYNDIMLLKVGRHFLGSQIILGRNHKENLLLEKQKGIKIIPQQPGPTALIKDKKLISKAKKLIQRYSKHKIKQFKIKN